ncbi:MAG TPA: hypothetical protein VFH47_06530, partial [Candidatus Thermoplasmatota archaeon]|nr:hypothetical protein [Candidatus Thermoplasmatota archaeon]
MSLEKAGAILLAWRWVDGRLRELSKAAQRFLKLLRLAFGFLLFGILAVVASAVVGLLWPQHFPIAYAVAVLFLLIPLVALTVLVSVPLRMKTLVRLIERGYPANGRELGIRALAMKWRNESIETEELLVETAWNELKKA